MIVLYLCGTNISNPLFTNYFYAYIYIYKPKAIRLNIVQQFLPTKNLDYS